MSRVFEGRNRGAAEPPCVLVKDHPISAFFCALGGFTFLKFVIKTLVVFSETFVLSGTNVSVAVKLRTAVAHGFNSQLKKFGAGKGSWAGKET